MQRPLTRNVGQFNRFRTMGECLHLELLVTGSLRHPAGYLLCQCSVIDGFFEFGEPSDIPVGSDE